MMVVKQVLDFCSLSLHDEASILLEFSFKRFSRTCYLLRNFIVSESVSFEKGEKHTWNFKMKNFKDLSPLNFHSLMHFH